jgi:hypothetical protein
MPFKFKLDSAASDLGINKANSGSTQSAMASSGLDVLFYNQEHYDTISILENKKDISQDTIGDFIKN